jgi:HK97 family phage prohead protease
MKPIFKEANLETRAADIDPDETMRFIASTEATDRYGDVVRADGWDLASFRKNPVILFGHSHSAPVGVATRVWVEAKKLMADIKLAAQGTSELVDSVRALVRQRILRAVSVGFLPSEYKEVRSDGNFVGYEFTKQELLEISLVAVPANQEALAVARSLNIPAELHGTLFRPDAPSSGRKNLSADRARLQLEMLQVRSGSTFT